jgi:hypothetical protein
MTEEETSINETLTIRNTISSFLDIFIVSAIARVKMVVLNCLKNKQVNTFMYLIIHSPAQKTTHFEFY